MKAASLIRSRFPGQILIYFAIATLHVFAVAGESLQALLLMESGGQADTRPRLVGRVDRSGFSRGIAFSPDGRRVLTVFGNKTAKLWDAEKGEPLLTFPG